MSRLQTLLLAGLLVGGGIALSVRASVRPEPRELTLIARDMAFYLPGDPTPNPTLVVGRGERVRIILRHEDPGMTHDFAVESQAVATDALRRAGTTTAVVFQAPRRPGESEYLCTFHRLMMKGVLKVR
jgi:hypothetical protein